MQTSGQRTPDWYNDTETCNCANRNAGARDAIDEDVKQREIFIPQIRVMRMHRLQLVGPIVILAAVAAAEAAAYALAFLPSSSVLWHLNLEVFSLFRKSRIVLSDYCALPFAQVFVVAGPIALLGLLGLALKNNLCMAISSNLSFVFAAFLGYSWHAWNSHGQHAASLALVHVPTGSALYLFTVLGIASFSSFAVSHFAFLSAIRTRR